ncbi:MAG: Mth938-like domain-containing protein [Candidatus Diapherotrites archaeon]|nr:Mth938-like domain-containing protein [Candidatus Diapherotrites archaeon]
MIEDITLGKVKVNGKKYIKDIMILGERVKLWEREGAFVLEPDELQEALWAQPEVIIIGTGFRSYFFVPYEVRDFFKAQGIHVIVDNTANACKLYNDISAVKRTVAALKITE